MAYNLNEHTYLGCKHWYLSNSYFGYNVFKLTDLQIINHVASFFLNYAANFDDEYIQTCIDVNLTDSDVINDIQDLLVKLKLKVALRIQPYFLMN